MVFTYIKLILFTFVRVFEEFIQGQLKDEMNLMNKNQVNVINL